MNVRVPSNKQKAMSVPVQTADEIECEKWFADCRRAKAQRLSEIEQRFILAQRAIDGDYSRFDGVCECGKHVGLVFLKRVGDNEIKLSEKPLCPFTVFNTRYRQALRKGNAVEFGKTYAAFAAKNVRLYSPSLDTKGE